MPRSCLGNQLGVWPYERVSRPVVSVVLPGGFGRKPDALYRHRCVLLISVNRQAGPLSGKLFDSYPQKVLPPVRTGDRFVKRPDQFEEAFFARKHRTCVVLSIRRDSALCSSYRCLRLRTDIRRPRKAANRPDSAP